MSHPSWVCGLKHTIIEYGKVATNVTPFVGVWIETQLQKVYTLLWVVTPFVGVWIET